MQSTTRKPVFNVFHQNALLNNNIIVALNPEMAEEIIGLVHETCSTDGGLQNREEYPHLYSLCDRLQSNLDWTAMQVLRRREMNNDGYVGSSKTNGVKSFIENVEPDDYSCSTG